MTLRQMRIAQSLLALAFGVVGIWSLTRDEYGLGATQLVLAALWLLMALFSDKLRAIRDRRRAGPQL